MKTGKRCFAAAMAGALLLSCTPAALGAGQTVPKEEVVYINLDTAGAVQSVDVVNIFELAQAGQIVDHGHYESVRNMTTTDPLTLAGDTVTAEAGPGRLYYEGRLTDAEIPWEISLRYFLDGQELSAQELAGKSGALEIRMTVRENPRCTGDFFDTYALQASFTLDGDKCSDITAEGATAANVGSDKQLTYTILPGRGADISITARVTDFEMDGAAINGVPLSLDVEVDDEALLGKVTELTDAVKTLDEGAAELSGGAETLAESVSGDLLTGVDQVASGASSVSAGAGTLKAGGSSVNAGASSVSAGAGEVSAGAQELNAGLADLETGLATLDSSSSSLTEGSAAILTALQQVQTAVDGVELTDEDVTTVKTELESIQTSATGMADQLSGAATIITALQTIEGTYETIAASLAAAIAELPEETDKTALNGALSSLQSNNTALSESVGGLVTLSGLAGTLSTDLAAVAAVAGELAGHVDDLPTLLGEIQTGVDTLVADYTALDTGIQTYTQGVADAYAGCTALAAGSATLAAGSASLATGASELYSGTGQLLGGINSLSSGAGTLSQGAQALSGGAAELAEGVGELSGGAAELAEGTAAMREQTDGMDTKIGEQVDALLDDITGGSGPVVSFVSAENTSVKAVQFVIRTPAIEKTAPATPAPEPAEETSFWEKLTALF